MKRLAGPLCAAVLLAVGLWGCGDESKGIGTAGPVEKEVVLVPEQDGPSMPGPEGFVWVPGGTFWMGTNYGGAHEKPVHQVTVDAFWMQATEVTNTQFMEFVEATGYVTVAERPLNPADFPGVPQENLVPGALVFTPPDSEVTDLDDWTQWWTYLPGANWRHPEGPGSSIDERMDHPAVQVCHEDAMAYCEWKDYRLPTEAEWEFAARSGLDQQSYGWGAEPKHRTGEVANIWQGPFPNDNSRLDGYRTTAPVAQYPANAYGLYDMAGNVWEHTIDWFRFDYYRQSPKINPPGPAESESYDPNEPGVAKRTIRGGSYLCSDVYCSGFRPSARMSTTPDTASMHVGFRCVKPAGGELVLKAASGE